MNVFSNQDLDLFDSKGISAETIALQIENFKQGFPFAEIVKPATPGDGIEVLSTTEVESLLQDYDQYSRSLKIIKFVPASGAASRMFKALYEYLEQAKNIDQHSLLESDKGFNSTWNFIEKIKYFAFYHDLNLAMIQSGTSLEDQINKGNFAAVVDCLVNSGGLDYGSLPKGLLKFHTYDPANRVALEEHLVEAADYATSGDGVAYVHFTVSQEHLQKFKEKANEIIGQYEHKFGISYNISYSVQKPSTDTIAVDMNNQPFRELDGSILFRPGGHGALIENLGELDADLVFIKNIDNVVPDRLKKETTRYKKAIGGLLLKLQEKTFKFLAQLEGGNIDEENLESIIIFAVTKLKITLPDNFETYSFQLKTDFLIKNLNRPIRICGMVKNEGEPGGGPFWIKNSKGEVSLQVVESSQIDHKNMEQIEHAKSATHFNPVDLVCGTKDYKGNRFDLHHFIDPQTGFISEKSKNGKTLKALELPGLWNGAMADWITLFVEVPIITFNPVKTVNDLLRPQHQPA